MKALNKLIVVAFLFTVSLNSFAQNDKIFEELEKDKKQSNENNHSYNSGSNSSSSNNYSSTASDIEAFLSLFKIFFYLGDGIYTAQAKTLAARADHRELISAEGSMHLGYAQKYNSVLTSPQIRLNWGIFSTEYRQQWISDRTFILNTHDWQVLKLNIPIHPLTLSMGLGFTHVPDVKISYLQYTVAGRLRLIKEKALAEVTYRGSSAKTSARFLEEFKATFDYEIKRYPIGKSANLRISPMVGFLYQNYFNKFQQRYVMAGLNLRFF